MMDMDQNEKIQNELEIIKKLLITQLYISGVSPEVIAKVTKMSTKTLYTFLPKNRRKSKE